MTKETVRAKVEKGKDKWLLWVGYILDEDDEKREIEYFGKFAPSKKSVMGIARSMIDNTSPYRIIIQNLEPFKHDLRCSTLQSELTDFFRMDEE